MKAEEAAMASKQLFEAWRAVGSALMTRRTPPEAVDAELPGNHGLTKPRPSPLRARYYALGKVPDDANPLWFDVSWESWTRQAELVPLGEQALAVGNVTAGQALFQELEALGQQPNAHPVVLIDALIGLGDVERTRDNATEACDLYARAEQLAEAHGLSFGRVRAMVPWLFLQIRSRSRQELMPSAELCLQLSQELDDAMYIGNSYMVRAELLATDGDLEGAVAAADAASEYFGDHPVALPGLYVRLADAFRLAEDTAGLRRALVRALAATRKVDQPTERASALDLLASARMAAKQWDSARVAAQGAVAVAQRSGSGRETANANMTLSLIERRSGHPRRALEARSAATDYFLGRPDSQGSLAYCLIERAELWLELGHADKAADDTRAALTALEELRCTQHRPAGQQEYRRRFAQVYRRGLQLACKMRDPVLFVSIFEGLWGRRLSGLTRGDGPQLDEDVILRTHILAQAKLAGTATREDGRQRAIRLLGRQGLRAALPGMIEDQTDAAIASLATPYDHALAQGHLESIPLGTAALLVAPVPERPLRYFALIVDHEGNASCDEYAMPDEVRAALDGWRANPLLEAVQDLESFVTLIPEEIDRIPPGTPLLIVPLEEFWPLPWAAMPLPGGTIIGARHPLKFSPSLALAANSRERTLPARRESYQWVGPRVNVQLLAGLPATPCASPSEALYRVARGEAHQDMIVVAHGIPIDGVGHFLDFGDSLVLSPLQAMRARPPGRIGLVACWGSFVPDDQSGDPLTVGTILQARGAASVLATSAELSDDIHGAYFVDTLFNRDESAEWSVSLHLTIADNWQYPEFQDNLRRWAPLRVLGAW